MGGHKSRFTGCLTKRRQRGHVDHWRGLSLSHRRAKGTKTDQRQTGSCEGLNKAYKGEEVDRETHRFRNRYVCRSGSGSSTEKRIIKAGTGVAKGRT